MNNFPSDGAIHSMHLFSAGENRSWSFSPGRQDSSQAR